MDPIEQIWQSALRLHQEGRLGEAEKGYRRILESRPGHAGALHYLGLLAHQKGNNDQAIVLLKQSIRSGPRSASFHFNLGTVLMALNRWKEAVDAFTQATTLNPSYYEAWCNLGVSMRKSGRADKAIAAYRSAFAIKQDAHCAYNMALALEETGDHGAAIDAYRQAVKIDPTLGAAYNGMGNSLRAMNRLDEAVEAYRRALRTEPAPADANNNLGLTLMTLGRAGEAAEAFRAATRGNPGNPTVFFNLGNALYEEELLNETIAAYRQAIAIRPDYAEAHNNLGVAFKSAGHLEEAIAQYRRALELRADYIEAWNNLGNALESANRPEEAASAYHSALALKPDHYEILCNLAHALSTQGRLDEAVVQYRRAQAIQPDRPDAYSAMAFIVHAGQHDENMQAMQDLLKRDDLNTKQRADLHFALGKGYEELRDYERAFAEYDAGNSVKRATINYDIENDREFFRQIQNTFDGRFFQEHQGWQLPSDRPIFIVGMPRSGTTLTEQILASHSRVSGAGELGYLEHTMFTMCPALVHGGFPRACRDLGPDDLRRIAERYLARIELYSNGRTHITNKLPSNYIYIGMIKILFQDARVIHCRRDPVDTCLSCYKQNFVGDINFSYDLRELGLYYRLYEQLMKHWHHVLPGYVLDVRYEELIEDQETQTRRILDFCKLPWEEACLRFNESGRSVKTASLAQVRQPLYKSAINRWKKYEKQLAPLLEALQTP